MMTFKPHLAGEGVYTQISYPKLASPKLNGVRGLVQGGRLYARSLKLIPNLYTNARFSQDSLEGYDGELVVGDFGARNVFTTSTSALMSFNGNPDAKLYVFDRYHPTLSFEDRIKELHEHYKTNDEKANVILVPHKMVHSDAEVDAYMLEMLALGYEGLVLRDPKAKYKQGRSTDLEGSFLRIVPWHSSEVEILGISEGQINNNESVVNELGNLRKSSNKENVVGSGRAGSFQVRDLKTNALFSMAVPAVELQTDVWLNQSKYIGAIAKYNYKDPVKGDIPRFPQYQGLRSPLDMSA